MKSGINYILRLLFSLYLVFGLDLNELNISIIKEQLSLKLLQILIGQVIIAHFICKKALQKFFTEL